MSTTLPATQAPEEAGNPTVIVQRQITRFLERKTLTLPPDYSPENALKQAWLTLQEVENKDHQKVIVNGQVNTNVVTAASVINALTDMVVQGLNVGKKQCYLIVYGQQLTCQRSYFGDEMLACRVSPVPLEPYSQVVYEGDVLEFGYLRGRKVVTKHTTTFANQNNKVAGAYMGFFNAESGEDLGAEIMTFEQIQKSWAKSKTYRPAGPGGPGSATPHNEFTGEMCLRTVTRKRCKPIINASTDAMLLQAVRRQDLDEAEGELAQEIEAKANKTLIPMVAPALPASQEEERAESATGQAPAIAPAAPAVSETEHTQEEETPAQTGTQGQETPKAANPVKKREPVTAAEETKPTLMLSQQEYMLMTDRLGQIPGALQGQEFVADCKAKGITTWAQVEARLSELEAEAAGF